jgi:hypothetical protein
MSRVWILDYEPTDERYEQIELDIVEGELVNPFEKIAK